MASGVATSVGDVPVAIYQFGGRVLVKLTPLTGKVARLEFVIVPVIDNIDTKKKISKIHECEVGLETFPCYTPYKMHIPSYKIQTYHFCKHTITI
jgi:hypothetical protein